MRRSPIYDLCLAIQFIPQEFANLQVTREEFLCMKAIILLNTGKSHSLVSIWFYYFLTNQSWYSVANKREPLMTDDRRAEWKGVRNESRP